MKILITGAHFTPAVAVIEELKKYPDVTFIYVGRKHTLEGDKIRSVESQVLPNMGVKFIPLITGRLQRSFTIYTLLSLLKIPLGFLQAFYIVLIEKPQVVLSFGGYVAVPVVICSWLFSIPIIIHEQTLVSGLANKISAFFADKIAISFKQNTKLGDKIILTGNPIRKEIISPKDNISVDYQQLFRLSKKAKKPVILFMGGNQGSHIINKAVESIIAELVKVAFVIHVSGDNKFKDFERLSLLGDFEGKYIVKKWIGEEYGAIIRKINLVICRAGANSLTELAFLGKPALVIPIPYLYKNEQVVNANFFKNIGLVEILPQSNLSADSLLKSIKKMLNNQDNLNKKAKEAKKIVNINASKRLALETILLTKNIQN